MKLRRKQPAAELERGWLADGLNQHRLPGGQLLSLTGSKAPDLSGEFGQLVASVGRQHGLVAAAVFARSLLISQTRFQWRRFGDREMFGSAALALLDRPAMGMTRNQLFASAENCVSYGGAAYFYRSDAQGLKVLRPDWVETVFVSTTAPDQVGKFLPLDAELVGYKYWPGGRNAGQSSTSLAVEDVAVWAPQADPEYPWRGLSWITAMIRDIALDYQAEAHVNKFFENAATPNVVYSMSDKLTAQQLGDFTEQFRNGYEGADNAWKSIIVGGGADVKVVGANLEQLGLKDLRGGIETHIAASSRVPAVLLGIREGMQGSSLNAGNYSSQRRQWADGWFSPVTQSLAASLEPLLTVPRSQGTPDAELWPDTRDVLFLQEDAKDAADILQSSVSSIRQALDGGFDPDAAVEMAMSGSLQPLLGAHTGLTSVQLLPPDTGQNGDTNADD